MAESEPLAIRGGAAPSPRMGGTRGMAPAERAERNAVLFDNTCSRE